MSGNGGSHVRLKKAGRRHALVVPLHKEVSKGTLAGILRDAGLRADRLRELL
ncbi:MAG: type II toxin-antitoxin system HicA family toxin [Solirubrobacterales bacterium]